MSRSSLKFTIGVITGTYILNKIGSSVPNFCRLCEEVIIDSYYIGSYCLRLRNRAKCLDSYFYGDSRDILGWKLQDIISFIMGITLLTDRQFIGGEGWWGRPSIFYFFVFFIVKGFTMSYGRKICAFFLISTVLYCF